MAGGEYVLWTGQCGPAWSEGRSRVVIPGATAGRVHIREAQLCLCEGVCVFVLHTHVSMCPVCLYSCVCTVVCLVYPVVWVCAQAACVFEYVHLCVYTCVSV